MSFVRKSAAAWLVCVAVTTPAAAQDNPTSAVPSFESLDRNGDNRLSRTEAGYNKLLSEIFVSSDTDGDGFVSRAEYEEATSSNRLAGEIHNRI